MDDNLKSYLSGMEKIKADEALKQQVVKNMLSERFQKEKESSFNDEDRSIRLRFGRMLAVAAIAVVLALTVILTPIIVLYGGAVQLPAPANVRILGDTLHWDLVENAKEYEININGSTVGTTAESSYSLAQLTEPEVYTVTVRALGRRRRYKQSAVSRAVRHYVATHGLTFGLINYHSYEVIGAEESVRALETIIIPAFWQGLPVTRIGAGAFASFANLRRVEIPSGIRSIGEDAFFGCVSLQYVTIPAGADIGRNAFAGCPLLDFTISSGGFSDIYLLDRGSIIRIADSVLVLGSANTVIPDYVKGIEAYAFYGVSNLETLVIPHGVLFIGEHAFKDFTGGWEVTIIMRSATPPPQQNAFDDVKQILVPADALAVYKAEWPEYAHKIFAE
ncbi:MAG: leucine-rich repeat domain-containing protein [Firmicutes bacterium]|nr:leucine-rich repeat domain-containing protein [Bacillota bacterium]